MPNDVLFDCHLSLLSWTSGRKNHLYSSYSATEIFVVVCFDK